MDQAAFKYAWSKYRYQRRGLMAMIWPREAAVLSRLLCQRRDRLADREFRNLNVGSTSQRQQVVFATTSIPKFM